MARIRSIKPEIWTDEKLAPETVLTRFTFLGLIGNADDAGRLVDNLKLLDGLIFPETDDSVREALVRLAEIGLILRYTSESGQRLIQIVGWEKHQKVDKPSKYVMPPPPENLVKSSRNSRETIANVSRDPRAPTMDQGPRTMDHGPRTEEHGPTSVAREETPPSTPSDDPDPIHPEADRLANLLADLIEQNGCKRPTVTTSWLREIDRMIRIDKRLPVNIEGAIRWCQADVFWRANILSAKKLREKFDTMRLQADRSRASPKNQGVSDDDITAFLRERGAS